MHLRYLTEHFVHPWRMHQGVLLFFIFLCYFLGFLHLITLYVTLIDKHFIIACYSLLMLLKYSSETNVPVKLK